LGARVVSFPQTRARRTAAAPLARPGLVASAAHPRENELIYRLFRFTQIAPPFFVGASMKAFRRLLFLGMAPAAPIAICSLAMAAARDGDWAPLTALAGEGRELAFETWDDAIAAMDFFALGAPADLCAALAQTGLAAKQPASLRERGWWPPGAGEAGSADPTGSTMTNRLALLCRGAGWAARRGDGDSVALDRACARLGDPDAWESQAFVALFLSETSRPDQPDRAAFALLPPNFSRLLGQRVGARDALADAQSACELAGASERALAAVVGGALARAGRGAALGSLKTAAAKHRPQLPDSLANALARSAEPAWADAFRQIEPPRERAASLATLLLSRPAASWPSVRGPSTLESDAAVRSVWRFAEQAWGLSGVARAWPADIDAREFAPTILAQREADDLGLALASLPAAINRAVPPAPSASDSGSPAPRSTAAHAQARRL
jgi:hypothetical protein